MNGSPTRRIGIVLAVVGLALISMRAEARTFTVTLQNGESYQTRYPPQDFPEMGVTRFLTDVGNWVAVRTSEIASVEARQDSSGFGQRVDTAPRFLGWMYVDDPPVATGEADDTELYALPEQVFWKYSIERFQAPPAVEPGETGGGIPLDFFYGGTGGYLEALDPRLELDVAGDG